MSSADWFVLLEKLDRITASLEVAMERLNHYFPEPQQEDDIAAASSADSATEPTVGRDAERRDAD